MGTENPENKPKLIKEMKDAACLTDFNRKLICPQDWFYSTLYRELLITFYKKLKLEVPEAIMTRFFKYDKKSNFIEIEDSIQPNPNESENPEVFVLTKMSEPEITYHLSLSKQKMQKNKDKSQMYELHSRANYTAKVLTKNTVESQQPILNTLSKYESVNKDNIKLLMYRCQILFQVKQEAQKILTLLIRLEHDPTW